MDFVSEPYWYLMIQFILIQDCDACDSGDWDAESLDVTVLHRQMHGPTACTIQYGIFPGPIFSGGPTAIVAVKLGTLLSMSRLDDCYCISMSLLRAQEYGLLKVPFEDRKSMSFENISWKN